MLKMKLLKYNLLKSNSTKYPIPFFCLSVFFMLPVLNNEGSKLSFIPKDILKNKVKREDHKFTLVAVDLRAFLQGPFNPSTGTMSDALRSSTIHLPSTDPYTESPSPVSTVVGTGVFELTDANNSIVDWILLELRDAATPSIILGSKSALIQRDGDIVSEDGISDVQFVSTDLNPASIPGSVYVAIKHRNHLAVRTPAALSTASGTVSHDFSTAQSQAYQNGSISTNAAMAFVNGTISKYCMWSGDINATGSLKYAGSGRDPLPILNKVLLVPPGGDNTLSTTPGYYIEDVNMNSTVKYSGSLRDPITILNNVLSILPGGDNTLTLQQHL